MGMFGGGAFDFNYNEQEQQSEFGTAPDLRRRAGERVLDQLAPYSVAQQQALLNRKIPQVKLDQYSLFPGQRQGQEQLFRNLFTGSSATAASRGMVQPENLGAIYGSALQRQLPSLTTLQSANQQFALQFPEQVLQGRVAGYQNLANPYASLLQGGTSSGSGFGFGFGIEANG